LIGRADRGSNEIQAPGILFALGRLRFTCPICGTSIVMVDCGKSRPGLNCPQCGLVYSKNYVTSVRELGQAAAIAASPGDAPLRGDGR